jgi:hypothetical protein
MTFKAIHAGSIMELAEKTWITMKESKSVTKDPICGMTVVEVPLSTPNAMERRSTFAATAVGKSFCPRRPVLSRRASVGDAVEGNAANAAVISSNASRVTVRVIRTDEEWMMANTVCRVFGVSDAN